MSNIRRIYSTNNVEFYGMNGDDFESIVETVDPNFDIDNVEGQHDLDRRSIFLTFSDGNGKEITVSIGVRLGKEINTFGYGIHDENGDVIELRGEDAETVEGYMECVGDNIQNL